MKQILTIITIAILVTLSSTVLSQTSDNQFSMNLSDVIKEAETRYNIAIRDPDHLVEGKVLTYALWRFRPDVETTLDNIFTPLDLMAQKEGEKKYKIKSFQYHRLSVEEGKEKLEYLSGLYNDKDSWEARSKELKSCIIKELGLKELPPAPGTNPIIVNKRKMKGGYTVENVGLETLPGLYVATSIYRPSKIKGKIPVVLCPNGHFSNGRYNADIQKRCAALSKMGAIVVNWDLFAWGESTLQFEYKNHQKSLAMIIQAMNSIRILDYMLTLPEADPDRIGITGGSGGGSQTMLISAIDPRITVSVPVVMLSVIHSGGCPCESGIPVHLCGRGTTNVEFAAMFAPKPQLVISDGGDWTANVPELEFPHIQRIYGFYGNEDMVKNVHFPKEGHGYELSKRIPMYKFMAENLGLDINKIMNKKGEIDEAFITVENEEDLHVFGKNGENLPSDAIKDFDQLQSMIKTYRKKYEE